MTAKAKYGLAFLRSGLFTDHIIGEDAIYGTRNLGAQGGVHANSYTAKVQIQVSCILGRGPTPADANPSTRGLIWIRAHTA